MIEELLNNINKLKIAETHDKYDFFGYNLCLYYWTNQRIPSLHLDKKHNLSYPCKNTTYCNKYNICRDNHHYRCKDLNDYKDLDLLILKLEEILLESI